MLIRSYFIIININEEIPPFYVKCFEYPEKPYVKGIIIVIINANPLYTLNWIAGDFGYVHFCLKV